MALIVGAVVSALLVCVGVGLVYVPAGVVCAGLSGLAGCYVAAYFKQRAGNG